MGRAAELASGRLSTAEGGSVRGSAQFDQLGEFSMIGNYDPAL